MGEKIMAEEQNRFSNVAIVGAVVLLLLGVVVSVVLG
jgi:predicted nucleic acid-binding Zn ribbon protein